MTFESLTRSRILPLLQKHCNITIQFLKINHSKNEFWIFIYFDTLAPVGEGALVLLSFPIFS